jgi:hypothetical protein
MLKAVPGYQPNPLVDFCFIVANGPDYAFETKFKNTGRKSQFDNDIVLQEIKTLILQQGHLSGHLPVVLIFQEALLVE